MHHFNLFFLLLPFHLTSTTLCHVPDVRLGATRTRKDETRTRKDEPRLYLYATTIHPCMLTKHPYIYSSTFGSIIAGPEKCDLKGLTFIFVSLVGGLGETAP
jgi:hypothetical protein